MSCSGVKDEHLLMWNMGWGPYWKSSSVVGRRDYSAIDSGAEKKEMGVTQRSHADSRENNILDDNSSQPSLKDYAIKYSKQSPSHSGRNRRPVILRCCRWTNIWVYTSAANQNYSTLDASELEVLCNTRMFLCNVSAFITFITLIFHKSYYGAFLRELCIRGFLVKVPREAHENWKRNEVKFDSCLCRFFIFPSRRGIFNLRMLVYF